MPLGAPAAMLRTPQEVPEMKPMRAHPEPAPMLDGLHVADAMHEGVITCALPTSVGDVARMMVENRVHSILVTDVDADVGVWGVVSDIDVLQAAQTANVDELTAESLAGTPALLVAAADPLAEAVQLMVEHEVSHLIVVEGGESTRPVGVISTLDVARVLATADARSASRSPAAAAGG
jgi:CBS domain-containing protein